MARGNLIVELLLILF